jgi:3-oxoacyl-[acyl-carrier-protein] synthase-3
MKSDIGNIALTRIVAVIPKHISYFDDEIENYSHTEQSSKKLKKLMGYEQHRVVSKPVCVSEMVKPVIEDLPNVLNVSHDDIDAIVVVTQTPDYFIPSTSSIIHGMSDFNEDCYCIDINDGCNGYIRGIFEASSIIRNSDAKKILLITGDVLSLKVSKKDRNSYPLVGDAVAVTLIEEKSTVEKAPLEIYHNGQGSMALNIPAGGLAIPYQEDSATLKEDDEGNLRSLEHLVMQGRDVFTFTQTKALSFLKNFATEHAAEKPVDYFFLHQANEFILQRFRAGLKLDSNQLPSEVIKKYGNSSSATIPMSIAEAWHDEHTFVNKRAILSGFGVGLSWGAAVCNLSDLSVCKIIELEL